MTTPLESLKPEEPTHSIWARHSARCSVLDLAPPLVQKTASLWQVCIQLLWKEGSKVERHPLRANNLFCRKVEAALGNLIPLPIDKISEDSDEGKIACSGQTPLPRRVAQ